MGFSHFFNTVFNVVDSDVGRMGTAWNHNDGTCDPMVYIEVASRVRVGGGAAWNDSASISYLRRSYM